ncbi:MAG: glycosyltransferase family 4 protein [Candidatus Marinimicrobia bacterium]|nr:glycosyltransferase family 4 protein [Candidatus Neomarinimicrobiota bacterium]
MIIIVHDYAGHPFQVQLSRKLAERGYCVYHIYSGDITSPHGNLDKTTNDPDNFHIEEISTKRKIKKYSLIRRYFQEVRYSKMLLKKIITINPDVIISSNTPLWIQDVLVRYSLRNNKRFIFWVQDLYGIALLNIFSRKNSVIGACVGKYFINMEKTLLRRSDKIVVIADEFVDIIRDWGIDAGNISVIYNWAPIEEIPLLTKSNKWSIRYGLDSTFNIIYSGTLGLKHNPDLILYLAKEVRDFDRVRVVVISEGIGADYLISNKNKNELDNLIIMPFQQYADLPYVLATADILIAILERDAGIFSVPSKILAYMCAGRPIVLSVPLDNLASKIIDRSGAGLISEPNDRAGFLKSIKLLMNDEDLRKELGRNARKYAESNFDINKIVSEFEKLLFE